MLKGLLLGWRGSGVKGGLFRHWGRSGSGEAHNSQIHWHQANLGLDPKRCETLINRCPCSAGAPLPPILLPLPGDGWCQQWKEGILTASSSIVWCLCCHPPANASAQEEEGKGDHCHLQRQLSSTIFLRECYPAKAEGQPPRRWWIVLTLKGSTIVNVLQQS